MTTIDTLCCTILLCDDILNFALSGGDRVQLHRQLCAAVEPTAVGEVLRGVNDQDCEDFYKRYLHDFVRLVHMCKHGKMTEYEIKEYEVRLAMSCCITCHDPGH